MPAVERDRTSAVYSYCRLTDDLVDEATDARPAVLRERLDEWLDLSRRAYAGRASGIAVVDRAMTDMRENGVPFRRAEQLIDGMRMDVDPTEFRDLLQLRVYTYRVARDVGDDWRRGRVYLPASLMRSYGLTRGHLDAMSRGIRAEVRRAAYDTISHRARTTFSRKVLLGARGLGRLRATAAA